MAMQVAQQTWTPTNLEVRRTGRIGDNMDDVNVKRHLMLVVVMLLKVDYGIIYTYTFLKEQFITVEAVYENMNGTYEIITDAGLETCVYYQLMRMAN